MIIGVDISMINYQGSGVANYTFNLVKNLLAIDKKNEYRLFYSSLRRPKNFYYLDELKKAGAKIFELPLPITVLELLWGKFHFMPIEWFIGKVDVLFSSDFLRPPTLRGTKVITTIHDLIWKIYPEFHEERVRTAHERKMKKIIEYGDTIVADSVSTRDDIIKYYPKIEKDDINVIYPAIGEEFRRITDEDKIKRVLGKYGIDSSNFLFYTGAIEPRKNIDRAITVFSQLIREKQYSDFLFVISGRGGWKSGNIGALIESLGIKDRVKFIGFVEERNLPYLYSAARVLMFLSLYEGFGLPPLEAAACGTPTLLYNNSSLGELFKKGYPYTSEGLELETLKSLIDKKINVADYLQDFSWPRYCDQFLKVVNNIR